MKHVHLHSIECLEKSVTFLEDLRLVLISHFFVGVASCCSTRVQMAEGESRLGLAAKRRLFQVHCFLIVNAKIIIFR